MALPALEAPANKEQAKKNRQTFYQANKAKIIQMAFDYGVSEQELLNVIEKETGGSFSPAQKNFKGGGARGLIQFLGAGGKKTIGGKEYNLSDIEKMSDSEQLDVVDAYFKEALKQSGQDKFQKGELGLAVAAPAFVGKSQEWVDNPGWVGEDGKMSKQTITDFYTGEGPIRKTQKEEIATEFDEKEIEEKDLTKKDVLKEGAKTAIRLAFRNNLALSELLINKLGLNNNIVKKIIEEPEKFAELTDEAKENVILDAAKDNNEYNEIEETILQQRVNRKKDLVNISEQDLKNQELDNIKVRRDKTLVADIDVAKMQTDEYIKTLDTPITLETKTVDKIDYDTEEPEIIKQELDKTIVDDTEDDTSKTTVNVEEDKKAFPWRNIANAGLGLLAGAMGRKHMKEALKDLPIQEGHQLDAAWKDYMSKMKEMSQSGLSAQEKTVAKSELSKSFNLGVKNVMRGAGGSRAAFLANVGVLNANRVEGLLKLTALDAATHRKNLQQYGTALKYQQEHDRHVDSVDKKMQYAELKRKADINAGLGNGLIAAGIESVNYAINKNANPVTGAMNNMTQTLLDNQQLKYDNTNILNTLKNLGE